MGERPPLAISNERRSGGDVWICRIWTYRHPYAIMSILNLTANLLTPEYPALYIVQSDGLAHASQQMVSAKPRFDGTVGTIVPANAANGNGSFHSTISVRHITATSDLQQYKAKIRMPEGYVGHRSDGKLEVAIPEFGRHETIPTYARTQRIRNLVAIAIGIAALVTPYILIAIFSQGFQTGTLSTPLQRGFVMSWMLVGQVFGALSGWFGREDSTTGNLFYGYLQSKELFGRLFPVLAVIIPSVGGFVVVGQMIKQFGSCVLV
jgi:hypothetical protein